MSYRSSENSETVFRFFQLSISGKSNRALQMQRWRPTFTRTFPHYQRRVHEIPHTPTKPYRRIVTLFRIGNFQVRARLNEYVLKMYRRCSLEDSTNVYSEGHEGRNLGRDLNAYWKRPNVCCSVVAECFFFSNEKTVFVTDAGMNRANYETLRNDGFNGFATGWLLLFNFKRWPSYATRSIYCLRFKNSPKTVTSFYILSVIRYVLGLNGKRDEKQTDRLNRRIVGNPRANVIVWPKSKRSSKRRGHETIITPVVVRAVTRLWNGRWRWRYGWTNRETRWMWPATSANRRPSFIMGYLFSKTSSRLEPV